ncbi:PhpK family radical SAM P-methyltransferase [Paenibacillus donghaensis]|uniref:Uncharacterized protein n=1 Tax=Paenibacillus donghaensis TaxID=414771 RepID=A0A2Z2KI94_9BACL|nr:PhpK family radical SAM P-methyltransferase [Paenibacillus donghaensis]ASA20602.1 hypothetical protein B9T62_07205 [Paenibacillus donghaensis]
MGDNIDCLFIGHNEMKFEEYEKIIRAMSVKSGAYRDLNFSFIQKDGRLFNAPDLFNYYYYEKGGRKDDFGPLNLGNLFSNAIAYLSSYLQRRGLTTDYVNSFQVDKQLLIEKLKNNHITAIAIPTTLYVSGFPVLEIMKLIKQYNQTAKVILGGPFIANNLSGSNETAIQYMLKSINADYYINSAQGEETLSKVVDALKHNKNVSDIENVLYKDGNVYSSTSLSLEDNRLEENMINWTMFSDRLGKSVSVRTAISCPFSCYFCEYPERAGKYRYTSVESIEKELNAINDLKRVTSVSFIDDTFNIPTKRFKDILRMMIRNKYPFKWNSYFRCQFADREMVELMKESGCEGVILGIESGSNKILKNMNKAATVEQYKQGISLLNEYGIVSEASFIIGFIGEDQDTYRETVQFIEECRPTFYRPQVWYCSTLAPIWANRDKHGIKGVGFEWTHQTMDSNTAFHMVQDMFLNIKNSLWIPQYNFDFPGVIGLMQRGLNLKQITEYINLFNEGVSGKLINPDQKDIGPHIMDRLEQYYREL